MVDFIKRDKNDIFSKPVLGFLFKNQKFLFALRVLVAGLFFYAIFLGVSNPDKENLFTTALFWGIFWSFFMVLTLPTLGRVFCGICPHGFIGKYITRLGLKKKMPKWMQNRFIGLLLLVLGWWGVYYIFPGVYRTPFGSAMLFGVMSIVAFVIYFIYKDMDYCKYICPIGTVCKGYSKLSFTWLGSYKSACAQCETFDCAKACPYNLKPFTFNKKNSMEDCTLCMECSSACESINFKFKKPSFSLFGKFKTFKVEVWAYMLILASIPISMAFHHGIGRTTAAKDMIWSKTAQIFEGVLPSSVNSVGLFVFIYAVFFTVLAAITGMFIASKILNKPFKDIFYNLGYSYAPLFIFASLGHALSSFFTRGYERIVEGFAWAFGFSVDVLPLAKRGDDWLLIFSSFKWIAIAWAFVILYRRMKLIEADKIRKMLAFPFAASLIVFYFGVNQYRTHIVDTYGRTGGMHSMHGGGAKFQSVSPQKAILLKKGEDRASCSVCGMKLPMFYKTNHAAHTHSGETHQYCSIHCLIDEQKIQKVPLKEIKVVDTKTLKFIDANSAFYVIGSRKKGTMSTTSKYAFAKKEDAKNFAKEFGGELMNFEEASKIALLDFKENSIRVKPADTLFFSQRDPNAKSMRGMGMMHMGGRDRTQVPTRSFWLATKSIERPVCVKNAYGDFYALNRDGEPIAIRKVKKKGCTKITIEVPSNGYYNLYYVKNTKSILNVAKYEYKRFSHGSGEEFSKEKIEPRTLSKVDFEIVRLRDNEDSFYYRLSSGDEVKFLVLKDSRPLKEARVVFKTQFGWQKTTRTDKDGMAKIRLIQDYNPSIEKFNKRFREKFIVTALYKDDKRRYKTSYTGIFVPSRDNYLSYKYALIVTILLLIVISIGVFIYRYRVQKPFREEKFDEQD